MHEEQKPASEDNIKVTDRRSFTPSGERREPDAPPADRPRSPARPRAAAEGSGPGAGAESPQSRIGFDNFARYLGEVALAQIRGMRDPETGEVVSGLDEAAQTIDILTMLQEKTRGNLTAPESDLLERLLYQLKVEYARRAAPGRR
jgi:hypothetical protein